MLAAAQASQMSKLEAPSGASGDETPTQICIASCCGGWCVIVGLTLFLLFLLNGYAASTNSSAESWSRTWVWMSLAHQTDALDDRIFPPPPPPHYIMNQ